MMVPVMDAALAWTIFSNGLWIVGLATVLAAFSFHHWMAWQTEQSWRDLVRQKSWQLPWTAGMSLTCVGWGVSRASRDWETLLWLVPGVWFAWDLIRLLAARDRSRFSSAAGGGHAAAHRASTPLDNAGHP
jgi:hypothetical protein